MPKQSQPLEYNTFVAGLISEASVLNFPENASVDEANFVLDRDGTRKRRLGLAFEPGYTEHQIPTVQSTDRFDVFHWTNVGEDPNKKYNIVQVGSNLYIFDATAEQASATLITTIPTGLANDRVINWASVGGRAIGAAGEHDVFVLSEDTLGIHLTSESLKIRDLFGVEDPFTNADGQTVDGLEDEWVEHRPDSATEPHLYNLRNQTWAHPAGDADPIQTFLSTVTKVPSNSDNRNVGMKTNQDGNYVLDVTLVRDTATGTARAPHGYFIIDALRRGTSRYDAYKHMMENNPELSLNVTAGTFKQDSTPGGATSVAEYAGHAFFAGFSGEITEPDKHSPKMASYVLFSKLVKSDSDVFKCYQAGDPTSEDNFDIVATDGGFVRLAGAYGIHKMVSIGKGLCVFAESGVWMISGGSDYGFDATNYMVTKVTDRGAINGDSVVVVDGSVIYWGKDGIYQVAANNVGEYVATNIIAQTIQTYYNNLPNKKVARGVYDPYSRKASWLLGDKEVILDFDLGAWYVYNISQEADDPVVLGATTYEPYKTPHGHFSVKYAVIGESLGTPFLTFAHYHNEEFMDWGTKDAPAYLVTGSVTGGDSQRTKQVPYLTMHFNRTETELDDMLMWENPSSCIAQVQWEWTDSAASGRWGREFQAYRHRRGFFPAVDNTASGYAVTTSKSKLRGKGRAFALKLRTEPGKDCQILGWALMVNANQV